MASGDIGCASSVVCAVAFVYVETAVDADPVAFVSRVALARTIAGNIRAQTFKRTLNSFACRMVYNTTIDSKASEL